jgi:hypothetical protein
MACLVLLKEEQEKLRPDNALVAVLCDAVRLAREHEVLLGIVLVLGER